MAWTYETGRWRTNRPRGQGRWERRAPVLSKSERSLEESSEKAEKPGPSLPKDNQWAKSRCRRNRRPDLSVNHPYRALNNGEGFHRADEAARDAHSRHEL